MGLTNWTTHALLDLATLWRGQDTAESIARQLSNKHGSPFTRNMIIGKGTRLFGRRSHIARANRPRNNNSLARKTPRKQAFYAHPPDDQRADLKTLEALQSRECRWPIGESPYLFCARPCVGVYCSHHAERARR